MSSSRSPLGHVCTSVVALVLGAIGCSSTAAATPDTTALNGDSGGFGGNGSLTGAFGTDPTKPVVAAYWIGMPGSPDESGGGPFVYLFSSPVTCDELSKASGWVAGVPAGTQVLEMIIGVTAAKASAPASAHAGANVAEVNYFFGQTTAEARAVSGGVTLTSYTKGVAVDGTVDVTFPMGTAKGTFHATWCPGGHER